MMAGSAIERAVVSRLDKKTVVNMERKMSVRLGFHLTELVSSLSDEDATPTAAAIANWRTCTPLDATYITIFHPACNENALVTT